MIKVRDLSYRYESGNEPALNGIDLEIENGEYLAVIGPIGCGKTTLIRHLNGLLIPSGGEVSVDGMDTRDRENLKRIRQKVGMVFQNPDNQIVGMSVEEDVAFGPGNLALSRHEIRERVNAALTLVGLEGYKDRAPYSLSSGEKQLVAIAGVLAMDPDYIILDEPTAHLDPLTAKKVLRVMAGLHGKGISICQVSHSMDEIVAADRVLIMSRGEITLQGTPSEVFRDPPALKGLGLELPPAAEIMWRLKGRGIEVRADIVTLEEACAELAGLIDGSQIRR